MSNTSEELVIYLKNADIFQHKNLVLDNITLQLHKGEFIYLIGKTGSGKSSLLKTLYGELPLQKGEGQIAGFNLPQLRKKQVPFLRRKIGIVFQDFQLLTDRNVMANLEFVLKATGWKDATKRRQRMEEVLSMVGLSSKGFKMIHELSGGEQQRIVIARALLNDPELILADEPTGNLDPDTADEIMSLLKEISLKGTAVLMATHDYRIIDKFPGKVYRCDAGKVATI